MGTVQPQWQPPAQQGWQQPPPPTAGYVDPRVVVPGVAIGPDGKRYAVGKDSTVALLLSLFLSPVGQFYNGDIKKALAILGGYVIGVILAFVYIGGFLILGLWIWSVIDAYNVASRKAPLW